MGMANENLVEVEIRGLSFLWHQIRCVMTILFSVAEGKEDASLVTHLLDKTQFHRGKPNYPLADESGLVLYDCAFEIPVTETVEDPNRNPAEKSEKLTLSTNSESNSITTLHQGRHGLFTQMQRDTVRRSGILACLDGALSSSTNSRGPLKPPAAYVKIAQRARAPSLDEKLKAFNAKAVVKGSKNSEEMDQKDGEKEGEQRENLSEAYNDKDGERMAKIRKLEGTNNQ